MHQSNFLVYAFIVSTLFIGAGVQADDILSESPVKTIYITQFSHLDIGYTGTQAQVAQIAIDTLDRVLEICKREPDYKWTVESLWHLEQWMNCRDAGKIDELMSYVKSGRIGLTACYAGLHSATMGYEEFCRHMYFMNMLRENYGVDIDTAMQNDIAGYSWAYPQVFQKSGIKYFATGINTFIGAGANIPMKDRPFYWEGPDGSRVLTFIAHDPFIGGSGYMNALLYYGWGASAGRAEETVPALLRNLEKAGYPYDAILVMGATGDNQNVSTDLLEGIRAWNSKHQSPKMVLCTPDEFFKHIISKYGDSFPVYKGDWAGLWDQVKESLPYGSGLARITHDTLPAAEALSSVAEIFGLRAYPKSDLETAWMNLIRWEEHSGGGSEPRVMTREEAREDSAVKLKYASDAFQAANTISSDTLTAFASGIKADARSIVVWNPYAYDRSGVVRAAVPWDMADLRLVDTASGKDVAYQIDTSTGEAVIAVPNVPGLGYKTLCAKEKRSAVPEVHGGVTVGSNYLENALVRVELGQDGAISSIYDKELKKEFVLSGSRYRFGELIQADERQIGIGEFVPIRFNKPRITPVLRGPVMGSLVVSGSGLPLVRMEVSIYQGSSAVHVKHVLDRSKMPKGNFRYDVAYPLSIPDSKLLYDTPAGFMDPLIDRMPDAYPIVQTSHGGVIYGSDRGMTIYTRQAFNWEFGRMNSWWGGIIPPDSTTLLVRLMNNSDFYEFKEGPGEYMQEEGAPSERVYEATFLPHESMSKFRPDASLNVLVSEATPLFAAAIGTNASSGSLPSFGRMLRIEGEGLALLAFKKAENGDGFILRMMETAGDAKWAKIRSGLLKIQSAERDDMVERRIADLEVKDGALKIQAGPREIVTIRLRFEQ